VTSEQYWLAISFSFLNVTMHIFDAEAGAGPHFEEKKFLGDIKCNWENLAAIASQTQFSDAHDVKFNDHRVDRAVT
jgi:hypothetical protein